jgi:hypothetical protein
MSKDPDPLNLRPDDPMVKWVREANRAEEERDRYRRELERREQRHAESDAVAALRVEVADLRAEMAAQKQLLLDATGQALGEISNKTCDLTERQIDKLQRELTTTIARHYGELAGRIDAVLATSPDARLRPKAFKFSNETSERDGDILNDLPDPRSMVRKTTVN